MRKKRKAVDRYGGFLPDLFPDDFIAYAMQDLFAKDIIKEKMGHNAVADALIEHALYNTPIQLLKPVNQNNKIMATYKINITQGDSYDIHDNTGCTMNFGKKKQPEENEEYADYEEVKEEDVANDNDEDIITELLGIFYGERDKTRDFLSKVKSMKDTDICLYVKKLVKEGSISDLSYKKPLWDVLNKHGIYKAGYRNWANQV